MCRFAQSKIFSRLSPWIAFRFSFQQTNKFAAFRHVYLVFHMNSGLGAMGNKLTTRRRMVVLICDNFPTLNDQDILRKLIKRQFSPPVHELSYTFSYFFLSFARYEPHFLVFFHLLLEYKILNIIRFVENWHNICKANLVLTAILYNGGWYEKFRNTCSFVVVVVTFVTFVPIEFNNGLHTWPIRLLCARNRGRIRREEEGGWAPCFQGVKETHSPCGLIRVRR